MDILFFLNSFLAHLWSVDCFWTKYQVMLKVSAIFRVFQFNSVHAYVELGQNEIVVERYEGISFNSILYTTKKVSRGILY